jgi:hypothetical protein
MNVAPAFGPSRESLAYARARDQWIVWLVSTHPVTAALLASIGWFPTRAKALKRLRRLAAKGRVRFVGTVWRKVGRSEHVFCRWRPKEDNLIHEVELTELCFHLDAAKILRGPHATDAQIRPDAEVSINGRVYYLELDRGSMGYAQMERRFRLYAGFPHFVLWVCPTAERRDGLRARADGMRHCALFTTFGEAIISPHTEIWLDVRGERVALPRQGVGTG